MQSEGRYAVGHVSSYHSGRAGGSVPVIGQVEAATSSGSAGAGEDNHGSDDVLMHDPLVHEVQNSSPSLSVQDAGEDRCMADQCMHLCRLEGGDSQWPRRASTESACEVDQCVAAGDTKGEIYYHSDGKDARVAEPSAQGNLPRLRAGKRQVGLAERTLRAYGVPGGEFEAEMPRHEFKAETPPPPSDSPDHELPPGGNEEVHKLGKVSSMRQSTKTCRMRAANVVTATPVNTSTVKEIPVGEQPHRLMSQTAQDRLRTALGQAATSSKLSLGTAPTVPRVVGSGDQRNAMIWELLLISSHEHCPRMLRI